MPTLVAALIGDREMCATHVGRLNRERAITWVRGKWPMLVAYLFVGAAACAFTPTSDLGAIWRAVMGIGSVIAFAGAVSGGSVVAGSRNIVVQVLSHLERPALRMMILAAAVFGLDDFLNGAPYSRGLVHFTVATLLAHEYVRLTAATRRFRDGGRT